MQYNSQSDNQDIVSLVGDMTGIDTTNEIKQITRAANQASRNIWTWIFESYGGWVYDDSNKTNLPTVTADLVADQAKYTLPSEALTVRGLEFKNTGGDWTKLDALSEEQIRQFVSEQEFQDQSGQPRWYTPYAGLIKLHPAPDFSQSASLRLAFDRDVVAFASTDTTKTPGFASQFHEALALGASYFIAVNKGYPQTQLLRERWKEAELSIKEFYSHRFVELGTANVNLGTNRLVREME